MRDESRRVGFLAAAILLAVVATAPASAEGDLGIGGFASLGIGSYDLELEPDLAPTVDGDADEFFGGAGFLLDTAVGGDAVFGYRLQAGFEFGGADVDYDSGGSDDLGLFGLVVDQDFAFRVYSNDSVRLWVGPTVRFGVFIGEFDDDNDFFDDDDTEVDLRAIAVGAGPVFGANIGFNDRFAMSVSGGVRTDLYTGETEDDFDNNIDFEADGPAVFVRVAFLARLP